MSKPTEGKNENKGKLIAFDKMKISNKTNNKLFNYSYKANIAPSADKFMQQQPCQFSCCKNEDNTLPFSDAYLTEMFLNHPTLEQMQNPIMVQNIQQHQFEDVILNEKANLEGEKRYPIKVLENCPLICYKTNADNPDLTFKFGK